MRKNITSYFITCTAIMRPAEVSGLQGYALTAHNIDKSRTTLEATS